MLPPFPLPSPPLMTTTTTMTMYETLWRRRVLPFRYCGFFFFYFSFSRFPLFFKRIPPAKIHKHLLFFFGGGSFFFSPPSLLSPTAQHYYLTRPEKGRGGVHGKWGDKGYETQKRKEKKEISRGGTNVT
ncbi:hypothetical protein F4809DRAFT_613397 [Biscogniauxia mediterranea]|nr:hypothetical protein F4809DRAFT_613397 [Biscogniauxia mediterranea]